MSEAGVIKRLDEKVVNRIAAGEIIQRPANAIKELIENSLDAQSSSIEVAVKSGGLKFIQIQDNGTGIRRDDLEIVCERFTTSKLQTFEDLQEINTYGFRGEALASISHIAHLTILTKTANSKCAYKASYEDGKVQGSIKPCAGNNGTQITIEDIFFNIKTRKSALRSPAEEYAHILEVVGNYAIHNSKVGFSLKKYGENSDLRTPVGSSTIDNIGLIFGNKVARECMEIEASENILGMTLKGYITNVNYSHKKSIMLLFINSRLVESNAIKKAIDSIYSTFLPKNGRSFVYLSLEMDTQNVDVNVHPTKHQVQFLHEEQIIEKIKAVIESKLLSCNHTRVLYTQTKLPHASIEQCTESASKENVKEKPSCKVRLSSDDQKIDKFFPNLEKANKVELANNNTSYVDPKESFKTRVFNSERIETKLTSIKQLRLDVEKNCNTSLREVFANLIFIGCVDEHRSLIQYSASLFLCDTTRILEEYFYETLLYDFQNFGYINLSNPLPLSKLFMLAFESQEDWDPENGDRESLAEGMSVFLGKRRDMLNEYFSLNIDSEGNLIALPILLDGHIPCMGGLPTFFVNLVNEVNWESEKQCFESFCRHAAIFYSQPSPRTTNKFWVEEHILFPAIRKNFLPPSSFATNGAILQIANLGELFKVFERC